MNSASLQPNSEASQGAQAQNLSFEQEPGFVDIPVAELEIQPTRDPLDFNLDSSPKYNGAAAIIGLSKIIASAFVILLANFACFGTRETWIVIVLGFDAVYVLCIISRIKLIYDLRIVGLTLQISQRASNRVQQDMSNISQQINMDNQGTVVQHQEIHAPLVDQNPASFETYKQLERKMRVLSRFIMLHDIFYLGLLVYGQILYFINNKDTCDNTAVDYLMLTYLIMGYIWLLLPLVVLALGCLCLPCVICLFLAIKRGQTPANSAAIRKLPIKKFSKEMEGANECAICMVEYQEGENIIQLACSPLHHFHEECIKKWLKINGQCPTCRKRLEDMK